MRNCPDQDGFITVRNRRKRNRPPNYWSKLPREIIITILQKLGVLQILLSAQLVCTQWRELICTDPSMWATIRVDWFSFRTPRIVMYDRSHVRNLIKWAVDHSCGSLFDLDSEIFMSEELLYYVVERCNRIRRLRIPLCFTEDVLERLASRLPLLEDFELVGDLYLSSKAIETLGRYCPKLTSLKIHVYGNEEAKAIARTMPQLRHICLPCGETRVTDVGVEALLDGCPHLESLDIQGCYFFNITKAFQMMKNLPMTRSHWRGVLEDPSTWSTICVTDWISTFKSFHNFEELNYMIRQAVDKSCGGLVDVDLDEYISGDILDYVTERCNRIRRLRGIPEKGFREDILVRMASRLPLLEDFELVGDHELSSEAIETLGRYCPKLTSLKIRIYGDEEAKTIARTMPQLRHICLPCVETRVTDVGVEALLDGCPHLESLDIQGCYFFKITRAFQMMKNLPLTRTQWRGVLEDPSTWSTICVAEWISTFDSFQNFEELEYIIRWVVDKSCGGLVDLDLNKYMSRDILDYVTERCNRIRRLRGIPMGFTEDVLMRVVSRLPLLEDFELVYFDELSSEAIETLGNYCLKLSSLKIHVHGNEEAMTIARSMPQLRHICLSGKSFVTDVGVEAILDGCPHLESLDIRGCYLFEMTGVFQMKNLPLTRTQWRDVLDDPSTWSTICLDRRFFTFYLQHKCEEFKYIIRRAVDKSCGGLVVLDLDEYMSDDILDYVVERCTRIRRLHGYMVFGCSEEAVRAALARLPLLEDLSLRYHCRLRSAETMETLMRCCPRLTSLEIPIYDDDEAETLARSFPQLRHLKPFNANMLTDSGVEALLDGCPHLESLDLQECDHHYCRIRWIRCLLMRKYFHRPIAIDYPSNFSVCGWTCPVKFDLDDNQFSEEDNQLSEEDVDDVDYTICRKEEYWIRREKRRSKETHTQQLRRVKGNKKAKRIRDSKRDSRREVKKEFVHWNKLATDPCTLYC